MYLFSVPNFSVAVVGWLYCVAGVRGENGQLVIISALFESSVAERSVKR